MKIISHRGNIDSINPDRENTFEYIDEAISLDFEVEIDLWRIDKELFLGHDEPETKVELPWLWYRKDSLWIHTKNSSALEYLVALNKYHDLKYFWHSVEPYILTSNSIIWAHEFDNIESPETCIVPLLDKETLTATTPRRWYGVCTDFPVLCRELYKEVL